MKTFSRTEPAGRHRPALVGADHKEGVLALFNNRRVAYSFNTRIALREACDLIGIIPGDEVLAPAYNCGSELDPLLDAGATIRLYPVARDLRVDPDIVERMIGTRTKAIYLTHYFGCVHPETAALRTVCDRHGLLLIEDCALSLLSGDRPAEGRTGDVSVFCFYKFFPVIGGGALAVNNPSIPGPHAFGRPAPASLVYKALLRKVLNRVLPVDMGRDAIHRVLGMQKSPIVTPEKPDMPARYYFDPELRHRRISRLTARALQSVNVGEVIQRRRANYSALAEQLDSMPGITLPAANLPDTACPLGFPVLVSDRNTVAAALTAGGVPTTPWWSGYNRKLSWEGCAEACHLKNHLILLPVHQGLETSSMSRIAAQLAEIIRSQ